MSFSASLNLLCIHIVEPFPIWCYSGTREAIVRLLHTYTVWSSDEKRTIKLPADGRRIDCENTRHFFSVLWADLITTSLLWLLVFAVELWSLCLGRFHFYLAMDALYSVSCLIRVP